MKGLTEKLGPLPAWAWIAVGVAVYLFVIRPRLSGGSAQAAAPSYVQVPAASQGGGVDAQGQQPVDLSPLTTQLTAIGNQLQSGFGNLQSLLTQTPVTTPVNQSAQNPVTALANAAIPSSTGTQYTPPAGYSVYQPSVGQKAIQYVYNSNPPPAGLTPATINADLVQRWTQAGKTPAEIAALSGLSNPGAHSSLSGY